MGHKHKLEISEPGSGPIIYFKCADPDCGKQLLVSKVVMRNALMIPMYMGAAWIYDPVHGNQYV
jgi:hypothetical protein